MKSAINSYIYAAVAFAYATAVTGLIIIFA